MSVVLASVSPIAVRLAASSIDRLGRTAGRLFSISTAGSIVGTFVTAFWLVPEYGTDQVLAFGAVVLLSAAAVVVASSSASGCPPPCSLAGAAAALARGRRARARDERRQARPGSPRRTGRRSTASARSGPRGSSTRRRSRSPSAASPCARHATRATTGFSWSRTRSRATSASTARSRAACGSTTRSARGSPTATTSTSGSRTSPDAKKILVIGLGGAAVPKRVWRDFHDVEVTDRRARPGGRRDGVPVVRAPARSAHQGRGRRRPALPPAERRAVRRDHGRRVLLRRRPVPPDDARVRRAHARASHARRRGRHERDRRDHRRELADHACARGARTAPCSRPWSCTPSTRPAADRRPDDIRNIILVATERAAPSPQAAARELERDEGRPARPARRTWRRRFATAGSGTSRIADVPLLTDGYAPTDALLLG